MLRFEWDPVKDTANQRKHGIGFSFAQRVFADPCAIGEQNRIEGNEPRWRLIGAVAEAILVVVFSWDIQHDGSETIRIISARVAKPVERRRYWRDRLG